MELIKAIYATIITICILGSISYGLFGKYTSRRKNIVLSIVMLVWLACGVWLFFIKS